MERLVGQGDVVLRSWTVDDAEWYATTVTGDQLIQRFTSESPNVTVDEVRAAIVELLTGSAGTTGFLIADAITDERLGNIALGYGNGTGEVSYWIAADARGRGAATRALRLLSEWAFATLHLTELRLWTHVDDLGSRTAAERAGYRRDPDRDQDRQVKGRTWPTVAYVHRPPPQDG